MQATDRHRQPCGFRAGATAGRAGSWPGLALIGLLLAVGTAWPQVPASAPPAVLPDPTTPTSPTVAPLPSTRPGVKAMVVDVKVQGNSSTPAQRILNTVRTRPGVEFSQETVNDDVKRLSETGLFANVWVKTVPRAGDGGLEVHFVVAERIGKVQEIVYQGAKHIKPDDLDKLTGLKKGDPLIPWRNQEAVKRITEKYYEEGRPYATVKLLEGNKSGDTRVVFDITEGPKVKVKDIDFTGNTFVNKAVLRTHVKTSAAFLGLLGGKYNALMTDMDVTGLEDYYKSFGFHDVRVARELRMVDDGRGVDLIFHIHEGPRYRVADRPQINGVGKELPQDVVEALPRVRPGDYYNQGKIDGDVASIKDYYGVTGRDVRVRTEVFHPVESPGVCQVQYKVEERPPARVGLIYVVGNEVTRQNVILRQLPPGLSPGQILSYPDIRIGERNLTRLNIFETNQESGVRPTIEVLDREGDLEYKDLMVRVQETRTGSLMFGVGVNSDAGLSGSIVLNERNFDIWKFPTSFDDFLAGRAFRGAGQEFRLEAVPGTQAQRYSGTWRDPFIFDTPYSLTVGGFYYSRAFNEYTENRLGGRVTLGRKLNDYWAINGTVRVENIGVYDVPLGAPPDYTSVEGRNFLAGFRLGATRDTRDSYLRATEGSLLELSVEECTGDYTFPLGGIDFNKYFTTYQRADGSGRHVLAVHSSVAFAGSNTPVYERYFGGGFRSVRGFHYRGIGVWENGFNVGGDFMFLNSLEYQIPILANDHLYAVGFVDSGTVEENVDIKNYRVSAGFGFRFVVPMMGPVPIALDFGFPIVKAPGDQQQIFNFWMGFFH